MKLIQYSIEHGCLTLTFLVNGEEVVLPIESKLLPEQLATDIFELYCDGDGWTRPPIRKITRTIQEGTILLREEDTEFEL